MTAIPDQRFPRWAVAAVLALCCFPTFAGPSGIPPLLSRISGKGVPDFTVVYECRRRNKLQGMSEAQVTAMMNRWYDELPLDIKIRTRNDRSAIPARVASVMLEARSILGREKAVITISQRGKQLLFLRSEPSMHREFAILYDGSRTLETWRGSDVGIHAGFYYVAMRDFVFPGMGAAGVPMARQVAATTAPASRYAAMIAANDGRPDGDLPAYRPGSLITKQFGDAEVVVESRGAVPGPNNPAQRTTYSAYRRISDGVVLPGTIRFGASHSPQLVLPFDEYYTIDYRLVSASPKALPESQFRFEYWMPGRALVQDNTGSKPKTIAYTRGKSIDEQFEEKRKLEAAQAAHTQTATRTRPAVGILSVIAAAAALFGWWRFNRTRRGGR